MVPTMGQAPIVTEEGDADNLYLSLGLNNTYFSK